MTVQTSRRSFMRGAAAVAGAALIVGFNGRGALAAMGGDLNPFVRIDADGMVTVIIKHFEMGQGTTTGLATLVAEELDADWSKVTIDFAPADKDRYQNLFFGMQGTGGSTAIANSFMQYRQAGAAAKAMLVAAAAKAWGVEASAITVEGGMLKAGGKSAHFGEFVEAAATMTPPEKPAMKDPGAFKLIGQQKLPRQDSFAKTNGTAMFAMDVKAEGMVTAVILRSPKPGGVLKSFDASGAEGMHGFVRAVGMPNNAGVIVYATSTWSAIAAREAVTAEWDFSAAETRSSDQMIAEHLALLDKPTWQAVKGADMAAAKAAVDGAAKHIEADFVLPQLAHAPMEPLNCMIEPTATGVRVHDGCQFPGLTQPYVAGVLQLKPEQVEVKTLYAGGSFGRRANPDSDYHVEAAIAFAMMGGRTPVKTVWTREDDLAGGYYRPMAAHRVRIGVNADGSLAGWDHRIATQSIMKGTPFESFVVHDGVDHSSVEGVADTHYSLPNFSVGLNDWKSPMKVLWWRSVGHSHTGYVMEVAMDMAAEAAGKDPLDFRLGLLAGGDKDQTRLAGVLKLAAEKASWGTPLAAGRGRGIAVHKSFNSYVAEVVEVSVTDGAVKIEKVTCAVDCGIAVNPDVIRAQMESGIGYGLGAIMRNKISFAEGEVEQTNFPDYEPLRISDIGSIETHIVASSEAPTGVGEPGLPPAGAALANAIHAVTGKRVTTLPMNENGVTFA